MPSTDPPPPVSTGSAPSRPLSTLGAAAIAGVTAVVVFASGVYLVERGVPGATAREEAPTPAGPAAAAPALAGDGLAGGAAAPGPADAAMKPVGQAAVVSGRSAELAVPPAASAAPTGNAALALLEAPATAAGAPSAAATASDTAADAPSAATTASDTAAGAPSAAATASDTAADAPSAAATASDTAAGAPSAAATASDTVAGAPSAAAAASDTAAAPAPRAPRPGYGWLTLRSAQTGTVYVTGVARGPSNQPLEVRCGRFFVRLGEPTRNGTRWLAEGRTVVIKCGALTEAEF